MILNFFFNSCYYGELGMLLMLMVFCWGLMFVIFVFNYGVLILEVFCWDLFKFYKKFFLGNCCNSCGLGFGFYIVGEIVRGYNGKICVECEYNIVIFIVELFVK